MTKSPVSYTHLTRPLDDQKAFEEGVKVNTQEELAALLQDFES